jgi:hypothetical protein
MINVQTLETTLARLGLSDAQVWEFVKAITRDQAEYRRREAEEDARYIEAANARDQHRAADALYGPLVNAHEGDDRDPAAEREYALQMGSWNRDRA